MLYVETKKPDFLSTEIFKISQNENLQKIDELGLYETDLTVSRTF